MSSIDTNSFSESDYHPIKNIKTNLKKKHEIREHLINSITEYIKTGVFNALRKEQQKPTELAPLEIPFSINMPVERMQKIRLDSPIFKKYIDFPDDSPFNIHKLELIASRVNTNLEKSLSEFCQLKGNRKLRFKVNSTPRYVQGNCHCTEDVKVTVWIKDGCSCVVL